MSSSSSTPSFAMNPLLTHPISEKLAKANHFTWQAQVLAAIRGARLEGYITGKTKAPVSEIDGKDADGKATKVTNPAYEEWYALDQQVLSFIFSSLSKEVLAQIAAKKTAAEAWSAIEATYASQTRARAVNTRLALSNTKKGNMTVAEYVAKMRSLGDDMAAAGRPLDDEELVEYILTGLDFDYNSLVSGVIARTEPISVSELYSQMLAYETRIELMGYNQSSASSANMANRRGRGGPGRDNDRSGQPVRGGFGRGAPGPNRGRGGAGGNNNNSSGSSRQGGNGQNQYRNNNNSGPDTRPLCQVCFKKGHTAERCWHRYDESYTPDPRHVTAAATTSYAFDPKWYLDSGSTDHITGDLEKLSYREKYNGGEQVHTASGSGPGHEDHSS